MEAKLTQDFPVRLRARRKRQDPRNERLLQSIATVLINSRCTQKVSRSCLNYVALRHIEMNINVTASSVQFPATEVALYVPIQFATHETLCTRCVFNVETPFSASVHMETLHLLHHRCGAATKRCLRRHWFNVFQEERQRL